MEGVASTTSSSPVDVPDPLLAGASSSTSDSDASSTTAWSTLVAGAWGTDPLLGGDLTSVRLLAPALVDLGPKIRTPAGRKTMAAHAASVVPYSAMYMVPRSRS